MSTSSNNLSTKKILGLADKLAKLAGDTPVQRVIAETTLLTQEAIVDKITNDIRPHDARRITGLVKGVTDLVDTGAYRASWKVSFPGLFEGRVATNISYALPLEYGTEHMAGFYVARDTARDMRKVFVQKLQDAIKQAMK